MIIRATFNSTNLLRISSFMRSDKIKTHLQLLFTDRIVSRNETIAKREFLKTRENQFALIVPIIK